jgi:medium-chain acyl-[acyl-carrier-protein] hydrolase
MGAGKPSTSHPIRLLALPYAGAAATAVFREWRGQLAPVADLHPLELPGRGGRITEPPCRRLRQLATDLAEGLDGQLERPFALLGHSLGALLAFEIARELRRCGAPLPVHLFVSSRRAPPIPESEEPIHLLPDAALVEALQRRYDAIPEQVLQERDLMQLLLPVVRADFEMLETYEYAEEAPLECPITAVGGRDDPHAPLDWLQAWSRQTSATFRLSQFPGGHFYFRSVNAGLRELVRRTLEDGAAAPNGR